MTAARRLRSVGSEPAARAVLYVRVSALMGRDGADFHSPEMQLAAMRRELVPAGLREVAVVDSDIDVSGRTFSREGLDTIRKMVLERQVDVILVYDYSRFGRNLSEALTFIKWLAGQGVRVISANEKADDTPEGNFMIGQFLGIAQLFSDQKSRQWSDVIARRARNQGLAHGPARLGYIKVGRDMVKDPELADVVQAVIEAYANGTSQRTLSMVLGSARGKPMGVRSIKRLVTSPFYAGKVENNGEWFPGAHEALISEDVHRKALARAGKQAKKPPRSREPAHSLSGLVWCGYCKGRAKCASTSDGPRVSCNAASQMLPKLCEGFGTPRKEAVEDAVREQLAAQLAKLRFDSSGHTAVVADRARIRAQRIRQEQELSKTAGAIGKLTAAWALDQITDDAYADAMQELRAAEASIRTALDDLVVPDAVPSIDDVIEIVARIERLWDEASDRERNRLLAEVVGGIYVTRGPRRGTQLFEVEFIRLGLSL